MCRSDEPRSTMSCRRSAILAAIVPPYTAMTCLGQGNAEHFLDSRMSLDAFHEPALPQPLHALRLRYGPQFGRRHVLQNAVTDFLGDRHDFINGAPAIHTGEIERPSRLYHQD